MRQLKRIKWRPFVIDLSTYVVTIVIGDELSDEDRIFQRPGPEIFPAVGICLDIRELQLQRKMFYAFYRKGKRVSVHLWALCNILSVLGGADLGLPLTLMLFDLTPTIDLGLCSKCSCPSSGPDTFPSFSLSSQSEKDQP